MHLRSAKIFIFSFSFLCFFSLNSSFALALDGYPDLFLNKLKSITSYKGHFKEYFGNKLVYQGEVKFKKPNLFKSIYSHINFNNKFYITINDGEYTWNYSPLEHTTIKRKNPKLIQDLKPFSFYSDCGSFNMQFKKIINLRGEELALYEVTLNNKYNSKDLEQQKANFYIDNNGMIVQVENYIKGHTIKDLGPGDRNNDIYVKPVLQKYVITDYQLNPKIPDAEFIFNEGIMVPKK